MSDEVERVGELDLDQVLIDYEHVQATGGAVKPDDCDTCSAAFAAIPALVTEVKRLRQDCDEWESEYARDVKFAAVRADAAEAKLAAARALHFERKGVCWECPQHDWPCPTARALDGEAVTEHE